jgi:SAM-dependent methyltransferase
MPEVAEVTTANEEAIRAWDGVLFDRFVEFRDVIVAGIALHGDEAIRLNPPPSGGRVLDIGCGFGDSTQQLAALVGPEGSAVGVDAAPRFIAAAVEEAEAAGVQNVRFEVADVQAAEFEERFDYAFSRFGTMFFANPVPAMRNIRAALVPGGKLVMVVWRAKAENEWLYRAEHVVERFVTEEEDSDEPTCGPGPFSMANADTTSGILVSAGFTDISLRRCDLRYRSGRDLDEAVAAVMAVGPAGEVLRLAGEEAVRLRPQIEAALREELAALEQREDGVWADASSWIVTATAP